MLKDDQSVPVFLRNKTEKLFHQILDSAINATANPVSKESMCYVRVINCVTNCYATICFFSLKIERGERVILAIYLHYPHAFEAFSEMS